MKTIIFFATYLTSVLAFACPDLAGRYHCIFKGSGLIGEFYLQVNQELQDGVEQFTIHDEKTKITDQYFVDGKTYKSYEEPYMVYVTTKCIDDQLLIKERSIEDTYGLELFVDTTAYRTQSDKIELRVDFLSYLGNEEHSKGTYSQLCSLAL